MKEKFLAYIRNLQNEICTALELEEDSLVRFTEDNWKRAEGGGGISRVMEEGDVFEKAGVLTSAVHGELPEMMRAKLGVSQTQFFACGLSLVIHPRNPHVPTVHANWRYFEMYNDSGEIVDQWFGGGQDLTPYYLYNEDAVHWHTVCKSACDKHDAEFYPKYKKACDAYFWNHHRDEARGIGGLFYDYCKPTERNMEEWFKFTTEVGNSFVDAYLPIVKKRKKIVHTPSEREWQEVRRGRYVEFNLVHDRGTLFGLKTNGRTESILMSLPPHVQWRYNHTPEPNSEEAKLVEVLMNPKEWV